MMGTLWLRHDTLRRSVVGLAGVLTLGALIFGPEAWAGAPNPLGGSGSTSCNDGTVAWSPTNLWPPNHKMHTITITYQENNRSGDGDGDTISIDIGQIMELPPSTDTVGAGQPAAQQGPDWTGANTTGTGVSDTSTAVPASPVTLRAERSGKDTTGRTYVIPVTCHDSGGSDSSESSGKMQTVDICVVVPHDQAHPATPDSSCVPS